MKLITHTQITVDGVAQGNGHASDEDREGGFHRGGWALGRGDADTLALITETYRRAEAFLFGRRTYELFASYWGTMAPGRHAIADALNTTPRYVASTSLSDPDWATLLTGDLAAAIRELKAQPGGELQVHGSVALVRWLLEQELVDELQLLTIPVIVGQGTRLFPQDGRDFALELVESRTDTKGVTFQAFRPAGRPEYATV
jgi:dihydrofolate reductase